MAQWRPNNLVLHDYGASPQNRDGVFNPYHVLIFPDGSKRYRYPDDPYGKPAPHAYKMNPDSIGAAYAGPVGSEPTPEAMKALREEAQSIAEVFPGINPGGHGEFFQATKGTPRQASRDGRDLVEASWRSNIVYGPPAPGQTRVAAGPVPMKARSLTAFAGLQPEAPAAPAPDLGLKAAFSGFVNKPLATMPEALGGKDITMKGIAGAFGPMASKMMGGGDNSGAAELARAGAQANAQALSEDEQRQMSALQKIMQRRNRGAFA